MRYNDISLNKREYDPDFMAFSMGAARALVELDLSEGAPCRAVLSDLA